MGYAKIIFQGQTKIDLTGDIVTADILPEGVTAHDKSGELITGKMKIQVFRSGTAEPDDSLGDDGDLYFVLEE